MADIFLSYARADQPKVERLAKALEEAGYSLWWDQHIRGGQKFGKDIEQAIAEAKAVIVAWSAHSVESEWVLDEASYGRDAGKLVPVQLDGTLPPMGYRQRQAIDLSGGLSDERTMTSLAAALDPLVAGETHVIPTRPQSHSRKAALIGVPLLALAGAAGWWAFADRAAPAGDATEQVEEVASVVVLPFVANSSGEDDRYFADGITEEILNRLDALPEVRVMPRTTAFSYRDSELPLNQIADELAVGHVVEGSMRRSGDQVKVTARLVRAADNQTIWSQSYDATVDDVFKVQADIAEKVANSLDVLLDENKRNRMQMAGVDNPQAFALYAKGFDMLDVAHTQPDMMGKLYESSLILDEAFELEPKLWMSQLRASDFESHVMIDGAERAIDEGAPPQAVADVRASFDARMRRAAAAARRPFDRDFVEHHRLMYADDWSRMLDINSKVWAERNVCAMSTWPGFLTLSFGDPSEVFDHIAAMEDCMRGTRTFAVYIGASALWSGKYDEGDAILRRAQTAPAASDSALVYRMLIAIAKGDKAAARSFYDKLENGGLRQTYELAMGRMPAPDAAQEARLANNTLRRLEYLARSGQQEKANALAREIDARDAGPTVLQIVVDECLCGAPFDIAQTPNYAERLKSAKVRWPPKETIKWPLKGW